MRHYFDFSFGLSKSKVIELRFSYYVKWVPAYNKAHFYMSPLLCTAKPIYVIKKTQFVNSLHRQSKTGYWLDLWKLHSTVKRTNNLYTKKWFITKSNLLVQKGHTKQMLFEIWKCLIQCWIYAIYAFKIWSDATYLTLKNNQTVVTRRSVKVLRPSHEQKGQGEERNFWFLGCQNVYQLITQRRQNMWSGRKKKVNDTLFKVWQ